MDSEKTLISKPSYLQILPTFGIIFALVASAAFYLCRTHDEQAWESIYAYYSEHLLDQEKLLYQDFYSKRLVIDQTGSELQLAAIKQAISTNNVQSLSEIILSDRDFRIFLTQKAPIYFSEVQKHQWSEHNKALVRQLHTLSEYQFALIPELFIAKPHIANLVTHIFVDTNNINFISNIFLFLLLSIFIERHIKRALFFTSILANSILFGCLYLFIADPLSPPLKALNSLLYLMAILSLGYFLMRHYHIKCRQSNLYLCLALSLLVLKILLDSYLLILSQTFIVCLVLTSSITLLAMVIYFVYKSRDTDNTNPEITLSESLPKDARKRYSEALLGLGRFNFDYARTLLRRLRKEYPASQNIMESGYHLEKLQPEAADFWSLAQLRIEHSLVTQNYKDMLSIFQDIQKAAPNRQLASRHILPDHYLKMLVVFLEHGDIVKAEHAFMFLELNGEPNLVKDACKLLIDIFSKKHNVKKQTHYQHLLDRYLETN